MTDSARIATAVTHMLRVGGGDRDVMTCTNITKSEGRDSISHI